MYRRIVRFDSMTSRDSCMHALSLKLPDLYAKSIAAEFLPDIIVTEPEGDDLDKFKHAEGFVSVAPESPNQSYSSEDFWLTNAFEEIENIVGMAERAKISLSKVEPTPVFRLLQKDMDTITKLARAAKRAIAASQK